MKKHTLLNAPLLLVILHSMIPFQAQGQITHQGVPIHPSRILLKNKPHLSETTTTRTLQKLLPGGVEIVELQHLPNTSVLKAKKGTSFPLFKTIKALKKSQLYSHVEPDYLIQINTTPTDSAYQTGKLWGLKNARYPRYSTNPQETWKLTLGENITVGIIDTGIRKTHEDLLHCLWTNPNEIPNNQKDDDQNGYIDDIHGINAITGSGNPHDDNGHGTHVAGTIAAQWGSGPHAGIAPKTKIMALKFLDRSGNGYISDALECLNYAKSQNIPLLNNSWGGGGASEIFQEAIKTYNGLFLAAAGNSGENSDEKPMYPAAYPLSNILSIGSHNALGKLCYFSNFGKNSVDLLAPGENIYSSTANSDSSYQSWDGTSMAAPHATGAAALLLSHFPNLNPLEIKNRLIQGSTKLTPLRLTCQSGGLLNISQSLQLKKTGQPTLHLNTSNPFIQNKPTLVELTVSDLIPLTNALVLLFQSHPKSGGSWTELQDNGRPPDLKAGDGTYSGQWTPTTQGTYSNLFLLVALPNQPLVTKTERIRILQPPKNDHFDQAAPLLTNKPQEASSKTASREPKEPRNPIESGDHTLWWKWTPKQTGPYEITTLHSNFDTTLAIYEGKTLTSLTLLQENDDAPTGLHSQIRFNATGNTTYSIQVSGYNQEKGSVRLLAKPIP